MKKTKKKKKNNNTDIILKEGTKKTDGKKIERQDLVSFGLSYATSTIVSYLISNPFLYVKQFYFKQFSLA